jgi:hypothetical protein
MNESNGSCDAQRNGNLGLRCVRCDVRVFGKNDEERPSKSVGRRNAETISPINFAENG